MSIEMVPPVLPNSKWLMILQLLSPYYDKHTQYNGMILMQLVWTDRYLVLFLRTSAKRNEFISPR